MLKFVMMLMLGALSLGAGSLLPPGCAQTDRVQLLLEAHTDRVPTNEMMDRAREVLQRRIHDFASYGATVTRQGPNRILVVLGRQDVERLKALIGQRGRLEFRLVDENAPEEQVMAGEAPPGSESLLFPERGPEGRIAVQRRAIITDRMIVDARQGFEASGQPSVNLRFDATGTRRFARATQENVGRWLAIVLDDVVVSAPVISEPILGGVAQIAGGFTVEAANRLAIVLRSGPLPVRLRVIEERVLAR